MGSKKRTDNNKITIMIPVEIDAKLRIFAASRRRSLSSIVQLALELYFQAQI